MGKTIDFKKAAQKKKRSRDDLLWQKLLACTAAIAEMWPWDTAGPDTPFVYIPESDDSVVFFSCVQDWSDGSVGIIVYPSPQEYQAATRQPATGREELRNYIESDVYTVTLTPCPEDVPDDMLSIYRRLGLNFEGGLYPWAIHKRRGYVGSVPEGDDLAFLLDCLGNFHMQVKALLQGALKEQLHDGDMVLRYYKQDGPEPWKNTILPFSEFPFPPEPRQPILVQKDSPAWQQVRALPIAEKVRRVEFDFGWLSMPVQDKASDEPYFPVVAVLTDRQSGDILAICQGSPEQLINCALEACLRTFHQYGIPETFYVCRDESQDILADFIRQLGVKLKPVKRLPAAARTLRDGGAV